MSSDELTVFIHIPKCAGSSIRESVRGTVNDKLFAAYDANQRALVLKEPIKAVEGKTALFGHFEFPISIEFLPYAKYFTVLRDPVERIISLLSYIRWNSSAPHSRLVSKLRDRDALTVLLQPKFGHANEMTRFFGRSGDAVTAFNVVRRHFQYVGYVDELEKTLLWLKDQGMSDGEPIHVNNSKELYEISRSDRAFIRSHLYEDIKLYDLLASQA